MAAAMLPALAMSHRERRMDERGRVREEGKTHTEGDREFVIFIMNKNRG